MSGQNGVLYVKEHELRKRKTRPYVLAKSHSNSQPNGPSKGTDPLYSTQRTGRHSQATNTLQQAGHNGYGLPEKMGTIEIVSMRMMLLK